MEPKKTVILDRGEYTTMTIKLAGGTITSWRIKNIEQIFMSSLNHLTPLHRVAGGINLIFPHVGEWTFGPKNGFVYCCLWKVTEPATETINGDIRIQLSLSSDALTQSYVNTNFILFATVVLSEKSFSVKYKHENRSVFPQYFQLRSSCYLKVPDNEKCSIKFECKSRVDLDMVGSLFKMPESSTDVVASPINYYTCKEYDCMMRCGTSVDTTEIGGISNNDRIEIETVNLPLHTCYTKEQMDTLDIDIEPDEKHRFLYLELGTVESYRLLKGDCWCSRIKFEELTPSSFNEKIEAYRKFLDKMC